MKREVRAPLVDRGGLPHSHMCRCIACQVVMLSAPMACAGAVGGVHSCAVTSESFECVQLSGKFMATYLIFLCIIM